MLVYTQSKASSRNVGCTIILKVFVAPLNVFFTSMVVLARQQLLKKAELLGHTNDVVMATFGGRGKITPSLSCDFVNYYVGKFIEC